MGKISHYTRMRRVQDVLDRYWFTAQGVKIKRKEQKLLAAKKLVMDLAVYIKEVEEGK